MKFTNKTILITGGATGIGFGFARNLAEKGNKVIITGRREGKLREAQMEIPSLLYFVCDVSDPQEIDNLFQKLKDQDIILDVIFNNAGVLELWDIQTQNIPSKDIFEKINTNLSGPIVLTQNFIMQADQGKENYIINMSSEAAIMPIPIMPLYSSSKAGLNAFTKSLNLQLKGTKFHVVEIVPPATESKMTTEDMKNTTKLANPKTFALQTIKAIESGQIYYAPSLNAKILTFLRRAFPDSGLNLVDKLSRKQVLG